MSKKTIKKSISLRDDVFKAAEAEADKFFGGNFSAYLTYLICAHKYGLSVGYKVGENDSISKEKVVESITNTNYTKSKENEDYIDSILNM